MIDMSKYPVINPDGSMDVAIYANWGVLAAEKQCVYTMAPAATAAVSEPRVVRIPAELRPYLTIAHDAAIVPAGDWAYLLSEILTGGANETPALAWYGKDGRHRRVKLADVGAE